MRWGISPIAAKRQRDAKVEERRQMKAEATNQALLREIASWPNGMPRRPGLAALTLEMEGLVVKSRDERIGDIRFFLTQKGREVLGDSSPT